MSSSHSCTQITRITISKWCNYIKYISFFPGFQGFRGWKPAYFPCLRLFNIGFSFIKQNHAEIGYRVFAVPIRKRSALTGFAYIDTVCRQRRQHLIRVSARLIDYFCALRAKMTRTPPGWRKGFLRKVRRKICSFCDISESFSPAAFIPSVSE